MDYCCNCHKESESNIIVKTEYDEKEFCDKECSEQYNERMWLQQFEEV